MSDYFLGGNNSAVTLFLARRITGAHWTRQVDSDHVTARMPRPSAGNSPGRGILRIFPEQIGVLKRRSDGYRRHDPSERAD